MGLAEDVKALRMDGLSVKQIARQLGISVSTSSKYCRGLRPNNRLSSNNSAATAAAAEKWRIKREEIVNRAKKQWPGVKKDPSLLSLVALYWAEGTKRQQLFVITNSDPGIIRASITALNELGINDFSFNLRIYANLHNERACRRAWKGFIGRDITGCSTIKSRSSRPRKWSKYGVCSLYVRNGFEIWHKIMAWIDCWRKELKIEESCQL